MEVDVCFVQSQLIDLADISTSSYTGSSIVADVAYDLFSSSTATGSANYEIMIWLGALVSSPPFSYTLPQN